ncbi:MAG: hypothetical protein EXS25_03655 [Pedosphaera sp.]|nr:hypothetical protein [Pedosphaera sp.]
MSDFLNQHGLVVFTAFVAGLWIKWLFDLFFLRHSFFDTRETLITREHELTQLRHEQSRISETYKNRLVELEAVTHAKLNAENKATQFSQELELATMNLRAAQTSLDLALARQFSHTTEVPILESQIESATNELVALRSETLNSSLRLAELQTVVTGQDRSLTELRALRESLVLARDEVLARFLEVSTHLNSLQAVRVQLGESLALRDLSLSELQSQLAALQTKIEQDALATNQHEILSHELLARTTELSAAQASAQNYLEAYNEAVLENQTITVERDRLLAQSSTAQALLATRLTEATAEIAALRASHLSDSDTTEPLSGRLNQALIDLHESTTLRTTLEAELAAVSESHARMESDLVENRILASRAEDLAEHLGVAEAELSALRTQANGTLPSLDSEILLIELEQANRDRKN